MLNEEQRRLTNAAMPSPVGGGREQTALTTQPTQQSPPKPCNWCGLDNHSEARCHRKVDGQPQRTPAERQDPLRSFQERRRTGGRRGGRGGRAGKSTSTSNEAKLAERGDDGGNTYTSFHRQTTSSPTRSSCSPPLRRRQSHASQAQLRVSLFLMLSPFTPKVWVHAREETRWPLIGMWTLVPRITIADSATGLIPSPPL